jgi:hypothetical protein
MASFRTFSQMRPLLRPPRLHISVSFPGSCRLIVIARFAGLNIKDTG